MRLSTGSPSSPTASCKSFCQCGPNAEALRHIKGTERPTDAGTVSAALATRLENSLGSGCRGGARGCAAGRCTAKRFCRWCSPQNNLDGPIGASLVAVVVVVKRFNWSSLILTAASVCAFFSGPLSTAHGSESQACTHHRSPRSTLGALGV